MAEITIKYTEDCSESDALTYATGCFNQHQLDYKSLDVGYRQGVGFMFGDGRNGYLYRTVQGNYVLEVRERRT